MHMPWQIGANGPSFAEQTRSLKKKEQKGRKENCGTCGRKLNSLNMTGQCGPHQIRIEYKGWHQKTA